MDYEQYYIQIKNRCAFGNLRRTTRTITNLYDKAYRSIGLKSTQVSLLLNISIEKMISVSELGDTLCMDQSTVTRNLKPLEKQGFVNVVREEKDARRKAVTLTEAGEKKLDEALKFWEPTQKNIEEKLGEEKFETFIKLIKEVSKISD